MSRYLKIPFRIYGEGSEILINRKQEMENMTLLSKFGLGSQVYAAFVNGICYQYFPGKPITEEMMSSEMIFPLIARKLAKIHKIPIEGKTSELWGKMLQYISNIPESFGNANENELFKTKCWGKQEFLAEYDLLKHMLENCSSPLVFCHNDLNVPNIIYDERDVSFIDVEYSGCNYAAYDVANHFVEFVGVDVDNLNYAETYPGKEFQLKWIEEYFKTLYGALHNEDIEGFYDLVQKFVLCSHLFWIAWALIQASNSNIDYGFMSAAIIRMEEYKRFKNLVLGLNSEKDI